jgi:hypothetical protein
MIRTLSAALVALSVLGAGNAFAAGGETANPCGDPKAVMDGLLQQYGEKPAFSGALQTGHPFTVTVGPKGTWTFLVMRQDGQMCAISAGNEWQTVAPQQPKTTPGSMPAAPALLRNGLLLIDLPSAE